MYHSFLVVISGFCLKRLLPNQNKKDIIHFHFKYVKTVPYLYFMGGDHGPEKNHGLHCPLGPHTESLSIASCRGEATN